MTFSLLLAVVPTFGNLPIWSPVFFAVCAIWRWRVELRRAAMPGKWVRAALFSLACILIFVQRPDGSTAALTFLLVLLSLKLLEMQSRRDYIVAAMLGYFLVLSGFFFNQGLLLAAYTAFALVMNTLALTLACGAAPVRSSLRLSLALCAQTLPVVIVLFIFFPRLESQFLLFSTRQRNLPGISERLKPGDVSHLADSEEIAFRAELPADVDIKSNNLYWRGPLLDTCDDGLSWTISNLYKVDAEPKGAPVQQDPNRKAVTQRITIEPQQYRWLFALDLPVASLTKDVSIVGNSTVQYNTLILRKLVYSVTSRLPAPGALVSNDLRKPNPRYLQLPANLGARARALADGWRHAAKNSDNEIVTAALEFFRTGGFAYTLTPGNYQGPGALEQFLFVRKRGFCEHFAAAYATLMRAAGVPARVVVGYQGGRLNWLGSHMTILQSDAHAWCEVWIEGRGWRRIDPTAVVAPDRVNLGAESFNALSQLGPLSATERLQEIFRLNNPSGLRWLMKSVAMAWDTVDMQWNLYVVGFNFEAQSDLMRDLGFGRLGMFGGATGVVLGLGIGGGLFAFFLYLRSRSHAKSGQRASVLAGLYDRFCRKIAQAGGPLRAAHEGPVDFAARATAALPNSGSEIAHITQIYVEGRYRLTAHEWETGAGEMRDALRGFRPRREKRPEKN